MAAILVFRTAGVETNPWRTDMQDRKTLLVLLALLVAGLLLAAPGAGRAQSADRDDETPSMSDRSDGKETEATKPGRNARPDRASRPRADEQSDEAKEDRDDREPNGPAASVDSAQETAQCARAPLSDCMEDCLKRWDYFTDQYYQATSNKDIAYCNNKCRSSCK